MYSLYKTNKKIEPFIDTGAYTGYKKIPLGIKGVYVFYDFITGKVLYAGKAKDLHKRLYSYTALGYGTALIVNISYIAPRRLKVKFYPFSGIIYQFYLYRFTSFNFKALKATTIIY